MSVRISLFAFALGAAARYAAKQGGRNRAVRYEPALAQSATQG